MTTMHDGSTGTVRDERNPVLSWAALFCGCFGSDAGSRQWARRGTWAVVFPLMGFAARYGLEGRVPEPVLDTTLAVSIAAAIGFIYWTTWRYMQDLDEMHQRIMLEAFTWSLFGAMTFAVGAGIFGLATRTAVDVIWVYVVAELLRGVALVIASRKYR